MNKKILRNLLIFFVVIALLGAVYMFFTREEPGEEITHIEIFTASKEDVSSIKIQNKEESFTLLKEGEVWTMEEYQNLPVYQLKASNLSYTVSSIYAQSVVEENAGNIEKYGLSDPRATVTVSFLDGKEETFLLGNDLAIGSDAYFMRKGDSTVYTVSNISWSDVTLDASGFFDMSLPEIQNENVLSVEILEKDGRYLMIEKSGAADDGYAADWRMIAPYTRAADNSAVEDLLGSLKNLSAINVFAPGENRMILPDENTAVATITVTLKEDEVTYFVGETGEEGTYFTVEGEDLLYLTSKKSFSFLSEDAFTFMDKTVKSIPIKDVGAVDITLLGNLYTLDVGDGFTLNGAKVSEEDARSIYATVIGLSASSISEKTSLSSDGQNIIVFHLKDGSEESIILNEDGKNFLADSGEGIVFCLAQEEIDAIKEKLE